MESNFDAQRSKLQKNKEDEAITRNKLGSSPKQVLSIQKLFDTFDTQHLGAIPALEVICSILSIGYRFFDHEIYTLISSLPEKTEKRLNFEQFTKIVSKLEFSNNELSIMSSRDMRNMISEKPGCIDFNHLDFRPLGILNKKIDRLKAEFNKLFCKKDGKQIYQEIKKSLLTNFKEVLNEKEANLLLNELNYNNRESISFEHILCCLTTKKGLLAICNFRRIMKELVEHQTHLNGTSLSVREYIKPIKYINDSLTEGSFYELVECYELLDIESEGILSKSYIIKILKLLKKQLSPKENQVSVYFQKLQEENILFREFTALFSGPLKRKNFSTRDIKNLVIKIGNLEMLS